jgi:sensor histidine kinase regulating citrate/malate metabolism
VRKWNHDMENHLFSLNYLIRAKKYHEADAYLKTILSELPPEKRTL